MKKSSRLVLIATYAVVTILVLIVILPMLWIFMMSFKSTMDIISWPPSFIFKPTLVNYKAVFSPSSNHLPVAHVLLNSIVVTVTSMVVAIILSVLSAYSLSMLKPKGTVSLNFIILTFRMIPPIALVVPLYIIYNHLNLFDTRIGLILPFIALNIPLATWILEGFFQDIPKNIEEAALIDGCTPFEAFWRVMLPVAAPGIAATSIFSFTLSWNNLTLPLPLTMFKAPTLTVLASQVRTDEGILWGQLGAISVIMIIPVILLTIFATKYLIKGIGGGAVKG